MVGDYNTQANPQSYPSVDAFYTTDGGQTWSNGPVPTVGTNCTVDGYTGCQFNKVSCPLSTSTCVAVGTAGGESVVSYSSDGGETWSSDPGTAWGAPNGWLVIGSVSCSSSSDCVVDIQDASYSQEVDIYVTTDGGAAWTISGQADDADGLPGGIACPSAGLCVVEGRGIRNGSPAGYSTDGGEHWTPSSFSGAGPSYGLQALSCPRSTYCLAVGLVGDTWISTGAAGVTPDGASIGHERRGGGGGADTYCACAKGKPINLATGDYYDTKTDLTIPGAGIPLTFNRTYDAGAAQAEASSSAPSGPLGYGWTDNLNLSVAYDQQSGLATVTQANGSELDFQYYPQGAPEPTGSGGVTWCPSDTSQSIFCPTAPRYLATLTGAADGSGGPWTFTDGSKSPITYSFTADGVLGELADSAGDTLTSSTYAPGTGQAACPNGDTCTAWSSTPAGESSPSAVLVEAFNGSGQLASVFDAASGAASSVVASFAYSGSGCSTWNGTPADLCSATDPGGLTTAFTYDTSQQSEKYQYDELTMSPPSTGTVTNTYDSSGRVTKQVTAGSTNQELDFAYATSNAVANGTETTVTVYPDGPGGSTTTSTYLFSNEVEVAEQDGTGATTYVNRDPATLLALDSLDANGNDTSQVFQTYSSTGSTPTTSANVTQTTDGAGNVTLQQYTAANLPWCSVDAADAANGTTCPSTEPGTPPGPGTRIGYTLTLYNSANQVASTTDPLGNTTLYGYTSGVSGVPDGLRYCTVDAADYGNGKSCPAYGLTQAGAATKTFDAQGDVLTSTDADGNTTAYTYGSAANPGLPTLTTDPDGQETADTYNGDGEVTTQVVSDTSGSYSATTQYAYGAVTGRKWCEVDPLAYSQGTRCPASEPTSPPTGTPGYTDTIYDSDGQVISTTNPIGGTTQYAYDGSGNKYCTVSPNNYAQNATCPAPGATSGSKVTVDVFDLDNRVVEETNPLGGVTTKTYDPAGNLRSQTVSSGDSGAPDVVTTYAYDGDNRVLSTTTGAGSQSPATTRTSYDPNGNAFCTVSATADAAGDYQCPTWQPAWIVTPPSPSGLYSTSPSPAQADNVTTTFFDANGAQVQSTNPDVQTSVTAVDPDGRTYCSANATNVATWLAANPSGTYPYLCPATPSSSPPTGTATGTTTTIFDAVGHTLSTTDQTGNTTAYTYDGVGNQLTVTDPQGNVTTNCYYGESCAASAPAGGGSFDERYSQTTPPTSADSGGIVTTTTYEPGGATKTTTTPSGTSTNAYDANGDTTSVTYSNTASGFEKTPNVSTTYFPDGTGHTMTDGTGTTTYTEDANGDVTSQQLVAAPGTGLSNTTTDRAYYSTGVLQSVSYPSYESYSSPTATYTYDALGNMASVSDWLGNTTDFSHDGNGNLTGQTSGVTQTAPSGTSSTKFSHDNANLLAQTTSTMAQTCSGSNETLTQSFSGTGGAVNPDGQVVQDSATYANSCSNQAGDQRNYSYDAAGRVIYQGNAPQGANPDTFAYDASGNLTQMSATDSSASFDTYTQAFDHAGAVQSQTPVAGSGGTTSTYGYDTLGDRTTATTSASTNSFGYNQLGQMTGFTQGESTPYNEGPTTAYTYTGDGLEASAQSDTFTPLNDLLWSVSCASSTFCAAVTIWGGYVSFWRGGPSWSSPTLIDNGGLMGISCAGTSLCVAIDGSGQALWTANAGYSWSTKVIDKSAALSGISCGSSTTCTAVTGLGRQITYSNGNWGSKVNVNHGYPLSGVSCSSSTTCIAYGSPSVKTTDGWGSWSTLSTIDSSGTLTSLSCPSASFCAASDSVGNVLTSTDGGSTWTSKAVDPGGYLNAVSCSSSSHCAAVAQGGDAMTWDGTTWTTPSTIGVGQDPVDVSCYSTQCFVAFLKGGIVTLPSGNPVQQFTWDTTGSLPQILSDSTNDYLYGPNGEPVEQVNVTSSPPTDNPLFLTYTPSNSSWLATNGAGDEVSYWRYDAYGNLDLGTPASPFGYAGQYTDTTTPTPSGYSNMRARWYDGQTGAFTSVDPAFSQTDQAYGYAGDDPVNGSDPSGLCISIFNIVCPGGGSVSSTLSFRFDPGAGANAVVNIGRGASFGVSDQIANDISPGASCTVPQNGIDFAIGAVGITVATLGGGSGTGRLLASGAELDPADAGAQLTRAGRAYAKAGEVFGPTSGGPAAINEAGQGALRDILTNPDTTVLRTQSGRFAGGLTYISPDGMGAVFSPDGTLQYFFGRT